jgi:hypothetical protein
MGRDVTSLFQTYRECARHVRNTYFSTVNTGDWDTVESFDEINAVLFKQMVLYRLEPTYAPRLDSVVEDNKILILPNSLCMPVMIGRDKSGGYWDHPVEKLEPGVAKVAFKRYFDWDDHDVIDFRYFRGLILESSQYPGIVGHEVLIETIYGKLEYEDASTPLQGADSMT